MLTGQQRFCIKWDTRGCEKSEHACEIARERQENQPVAEKDWEDWVLWWAWEHNLSVYFAENVHKPKQKLKPCGKGAHLDVIDWLNENKLLSHGHVLHWQWPLSYEERREEARGMNAAAKTNSPTEWIGSGMPAMHKVKWKYLGSICIIMMHKM